MIGPQYQLHCVSTGGRLCSDVTLAKSTGTWPELRPICSRACPRGRDEVKFLLVASLKMVSYFLSSLCCFAHCDWKVLKHLKYEYATLQRTMKPKEFIKTLVRPTVVLRIILMFIFLFSRLYFTLLSVYRIFTECLLTSAFSELMNIYLSKKFGSIYIDPLFKNN